MKKKIEPWFIYILSVDGKFYTGITKDLQRRLLQHQKGKGAKYTRGRGVIKILYSKKYKNHRLAAIKETEIKKLTRPEKKLYIKN